ncbi:2'-5' RNA ligase [Bacillus manliponensis]|uniref:2'-5' RNA ligase n=1 Tax=Bacillus manliponensis TaxID=574376 RepID=A0A073JXD3_9BACI|nr:2'-5' RNA ligase family protein [Bacillus manliponensis]KEK19684.1 2'-5' RNA ligase [Bacillus manliponensis]
MRRTIVIFLNGTVVDEIEKIREVHDPLFGLIPPHSTLVFPFESDVSNGILRGHIIESIQGIESFYINLDQIVTSHGEYLFLLVREGKEKIIQLHDRLYSGILADFLYEDIPYIPHVTVGRKEDEKLAAKAVQDIPLLCNKIELYIEKIVVESIGENEESIVEFEIGLLKLE